MRVLAWPQCGGYLSSSWGSFKRVQYVSTRGTAPVLYFDDVLLAGLATDGGLYLPESWPTFSADDIRSMQRMKYTELAVRVMTPFLGERINEADFAVGPNRLK